MDWHPNEPVTRKSPNPEMAMDVAEHQLLLLCSRTQLDKETSSRIQNLLAGQINWDYVLGKAIEHRVTTLLSRSLDAVNHHGVPHDVVDRLRNFTGENARFNLYRTRELIRLLTIFDANGIQCLAFKGPLLSAVVYRNLALREYSDLDVLVDRRNVLKTKNLLIQHGYHLWTPINRHTGASSFSHRTKDLIFEDANGQVRVELHWLLSGTHFQFKLDLENLWGRLETVSLAGTNVRTLSIEDLLLYLCMHGSRHGWERLLWICDVAEIIREYEIDWRRVRKQAHLLGCERMLALGLLLARRLLDTRIADEEWNTIPVDETVRGLAEQVERLLFDEASVSSGLSYWNDLHLRVRERLGDRMRLRLYYYRRYFRQAVVPNERDRAIVPLPRFLSSLYYILRPLRLLKFFGGVTWKKLTKRFRYS